MNEADARAEHLLAGRSLLVASNRGPVAFERDSRQELIAKRGAGGLVTALTHVMRRVSGVWVASAMTRVDRELVRDAGEDHIQIDLDGTPVRLRYLLFDRETFDGYYNRISNSVFWFLMHGLWGLARSPRFDQRTRSGWEAYQAVNRRFAEALAEELGGAEAASPVMLHDYHLMLAAQELRELIPDCFTYHFLHCPWTGPDGMRILPTKIATRVLEGMLANDLLGFQTNLWARNFMRCCEDMLGAKVDWDAGTVRHADAEATVRTYPISIDVEAVRGIAASPEAAEHVDRLGSLLDGRKLILRVDRLELSKNIVRGFCAFEEFLRLYPQWVGKVVHIALVYPSRRALPEYRTYEAEVLDTSDRINAELGTDDWTPILLINEDNYARAIAFLTQYDVLMVNPILDGMNLVSKEGPAVNSTAGVLVLSRNAGSWNELGSGAIGVNPYDVAEMAEALQTALTMDLDERRARAAVLRQVVERNNPSKWIWHQLNDIRRLHAPS